MGELSSRESQQPGSTDHLRGQLERLRKESSVISAERSEAQNQVQLLRAELEKSKLETQNLATERNKLRRDLTSLREQLPRLSSASCVAPDSEEVVSVSIPSAWRTQTALTNVQRPAPRRFHVCTRKTKSCWSDCWRRRVRLFVPRQRSRV